MNSELNFETFLLRLREGDNGAAVMVTRRFGHRLNGLADKRIHSILHRKIDAQDAVQSAYKSFFLCCRDGRYELESWHSIWLLLARITVRKCHKHARYYRTKRRELTRETPPGAADPSWFRYEAPAVGIRPDQSAALKEQLERLLAERTPRDRRIIELFIEGLSTATISRHVGCTERTTQRVLRRLRVALEAIAAEPLQ